MECAKSFVFRRGEFALSRERLRLYYIANTIKIELEFWNFQDQYY